MQSRFVTESKETRQSLALVVKEEVSPTVKISEIDQSLEEFIEVVHDKLLKTLPLIRDIQHHVTFILYDFEDHFMRMYGWIIEELHNRTFSLKLILFKITSFNVPLIGTRG